MDKLKLTTITVISTLMSLLGILAVPVLLLVGCNILDYATGLMAAAYRAEDINSYKSIRGITKKICQWLLVIVGWFVDVIIQYAVTATQISFAGAVPDIPYIVATVVAVWLIVNEMISILENIVDIGVKIPPFLLPIVKYIKKQTEIKMERVEQARDTEKGEEAGRE